MKLRLLEWLRCPDCRHTLRMDARSVVEVERRPGAPGPACSGRCASPVPGRASCADCANLEVISGTLTCSGCHLSYEVRDAVPRMIKATGPAPEPETRRTAETFGHLWSLSAPDPEPSTTYHFEKMSTSLDIAPPRGLIMDAGCGDGVDLSRHAGRPGVEVIGVELSDGGCATSEARTRSFGNAHVVQADLRRVPFDDAVFDGVYSYGVLHHTASPPAAAAELSRVTQRGGTVAIYLYEDFAERALAWRAALAAVNSTRAITTRLPPRLLYALCQIGSPFVFLGCVVPYRVFRHVPGLKVIAAGMPFRHGRTPFGMTGDLYDRFSAPIEYRYSRRGSADLLERAGLHVLRVAYERGWMVSARRDEAGSGAG